MADQTIEQFDIRDTRHVYQCCPDCRRDFGMGLTTVGGLTAVHCTFCWYRGPGFKFDPRNPLAADKPAFDAWNALPRDNAA